MKVMLYHTLRPLAACLVLFTACLALPAACTDDVLDASASTDGSTTDGGLYLRCTVAGMEASTYTRSSTEEGWDDDGWNENTLSRLDVFIFKQGDFIQNVKSYHYTTTTVAFATSTVGGESTTITRTTITTTSWTVTTDANGNEVSSTPVTTTSYYTDADYQDGDEEGTTVSETILDSDLDAYEYSFKKYGKASGSSLTVGEELSLTAADGTTVLKGSIIEDTDSIYIVANHDFDNDETKIRNDSTFAQLISAGSLTIDLLKSANAYLSIEGNQRSKQSSFVMEGRLIGEDVDVERDASDYGEETKTINVSLKRALAKICVRVYYKELDGTSYTKLSDFSSKNIALKLMNFATKAAIVEEGLCFPSSADDLTDEDDYSSTLIYYPSSDTSTSSDYRAVFYICPNNWLDSSLVSSMNTTEPIIEDMQTHLMMSVSSTGTYATATYYYKVPINKLLPDDNDAAVPDESYKELYRVDRNHVYNVTVYVEERYDGFRVTLDGTDNTIIEDLDESNVDITIYY